MKKFRLITILLCISAIASFCLSACNLKSDQTKEDPVQLVGGDVGISIYHDSYTKFISKTDGEEEKEQSLSSSIPYSAAAGDHVVRVWAIGSDGKKTAESSYSYSTRAVALSDLGVSGGVVSWTASARTVSVKEGEGDYALTDGFSYTAVQKDVVVKVKAEGGFDKGEKVFYSGAAIEREVRVRTATATALDSPVLTATKDALTWAPVDHAITYSVSYDGSFFSNAESAHYSSQNGKHTIAVKSVGDGVYYSDSRPVVFTYTTEPSSVTVDKTAANTAELSFVGLGLEKAIGSTFDVFEGSTFVAKDTCEVTFRAIFGFDVSSGVYYAESDFESVCFVAPAARPASIEAASDSSEASLKSRWDVKKFENAWMSTNAFVSVEEGFDGSPALGLNGWNNTVAYRFSTSYSLSDGYNAVSFDFKGDGVASLVVTLADDDTGYSISYDLGVLPEYWLSVTLSLTDSRWKINNSFPLQTAWGLKNTDLADSFDLPKNIKQAVELYEIVPFLDRLSFTIKGNSPIGANAHLIVDNVTALYEAEAATAIRQPLFGIGTSYLAREAIENDVNEIVLSLFGDSMRVYSTALETNFVMEGALTIDVDAATISFADDLSDFEMKGSFEKNGYSIRVTEAAGQNAAHFAGALFETTADVSLDFEDGTAGETYSRDEISEYTYSVQNGWQPLSSSQIYCREKAGSLVGSFATGKWVTNKFVYNEGGRALGLANEFSLDLANDFAGASELKLKLVAVDENGGLTYLIGSADNFYSFPVTDGFVTVEKKLVEPIVIQSFYFVTKNESESDVQYLYADRLRIRYKAEVSAASSYAAPIVSADEYSLSFSHDDPSAEFEYSLNGGEYQKGALFVVPAEEGSYALRVRALIGEDGTPSKIASYSFNVVRVNLSKIDVAIDGGVHTATWATNGLSFLKVGDGEYASCPEKSFSAEADVTISVKAEGYYDEANKTYYVGSQETVKKILVTGTLDAPVLRATQEGIEWDAVTEADRYAVSVNDGDFVEQFDRTFPFAHAVGFYSLRVIAMIGGSMAYSNASEYHYEVKKIDLRDLIVRDATATWQASAFAVYVKVNAGEYTLAEGNSYVARPEEIGAHRVTVLAKGGYDEDAHVLYYAETEPTLEANVIIKRVARPVLRLNDLKNGLIWDSLPYATGYLVKVNDGEWTECVNYAFATLPGEYSVCVRALGNGSNYLDGLESDAFSYTVVAISLSDIGVTDPAPAPTGRTVSFSSVSLKTLYKWGRAPYEETNETSFKIIETIDFAVKAVGGFDEENDIFYAGEDIIKEVHVVIPIFLPSPVLKTNERGIYWNKIDSIEGIPYKIPGIEYSVSINGGEPVIYTNDNGKDKMEIVLADQPFGVYTVSVKTVNEDPEQYPDSEAREKRFEVASVYLPDELEMNGATVSWTYRGFLSYYVGEVGQSPNDADYVPYDKNYYMSQDGEDKEVYVRVVEGYDAENAILYIGDPIKRSKPIQYGQLTAPVLRLNGDRNGLVWDPVSKATSYEAKINDGEYNTVESYAFTNVPGSYTVYIKSVGTGTLLDSEPAVFTYTVRAIELSDVTVVSGVATWSFVGIQTLAEGGAAPEISSKTTLSPDATETVVLRVDPGYVSDGNVYYVGEPIEKTKKIVVPIVLDAPVLSFTENGITFPAVSNANSYLLSVNGGAETSLNACSVALEDAVGSYTIRIRAYSVDEEQYPVSPVGEISYEVKQVALSEIAQENGVASFTYVGKLFVKEEGKDFEEKTANTYGPKKTTVIYVEARSGADVNARVRFVGATVPKQAEIIVPIKLPKPTLASGKSGLTLTKDDHADCYKIATDGGEFVSYTSDELSYLTASGDHTFRIKAYSNNEAQYPASDEVTFSYKTVAVSLPDLSLSGVTFSWNATAATVSLKIDSGSYAVTSSSSYQASYLDSSEGTETHSVSVKADGGFVSATSTFYYPASSIEKSKSVTIRKLGKPSITAGDSKLSWGAVSDATAYAVKVGSGSYVNQSGREYAYSTKAGGYTVSVKAVGNGTTVVDGDAVSHFYTVKTVTLSNITVVGAKASWSSVAFKTSLKVGSGSYKVTTDTSYTASGEGSYAVSVKAEGGYDSSANIYYYAASPIEKTGTISIVKLAAPSLSITSSGVTWAAVSNASAYYVKIDGGSYKSQTGRTVSFSTSAGSHSVSVYASRSDNSAFVDSNVSSTSYMTKTSALNFLSSSSTTAVWTLSGLKSQYSTDNGSTYKDTSLTSYTATSSGTVKFRAVGGYDASSNTYYNGTSSAQSKTFTVSGLMLDTFDKSSISGWSKEKFGTKDWESSPNSGLTLVGDAFGAGQALEMKSFANGVAYRFGKEFGTLTKAYKGIAFNLKLNDYYSTAKTKIRFVDYANGIYVNYDLAKLNMNNNSWYRVVVSFDDENLEVNIGGTNYSPSKVKQYIGRTEYKTWDNAIKAMDVMYFIISGSVSNNPAVYTYIDNLQFLDSASSSSATKLTTSVLNVNFDDGSVGSAYSNSKWKQYAWSGSSYASVSGKMNSRKPASSPLVALACGNTTYKYVYNEGGSALGTANHLSIDFGNWYNNLGPIHYRVAIVNSSNQTIYLAGSEDTFASLALTGGNTMKTLSFNFASTSIKSVLIFARYDGADNYLYMDNVVLASCNVS